MRATTVDTALEQSGRGGAIVRSEYLIDRHRVTFDSGSRWLCECAEFTAYNACRHSREAAGMRAAQAQIRDHVASSRSPLTRDSAPPARGASVHRRAG
jgi:hypothetical protein